MKEIAIPQCNLAPIGLAVVLLMGSGGAIAQSLSQADAECFYRWAEKKVPQILQPANTAVDKYAFKTRTYPAGIVSIDDSKKRIAFTVKNTKQKTFVQTEVVGKYQENDYDNYLAIAKKANCGNQPNSIGINNADCLFDWVQTVVPFLNSMFTSLDTRENNYYEGRYYEREQIIVDMNFNVYFHQSDFNNYTSNTILPIDKNRYPNANNWVEVAKAEYCGTPPPPPPPPPDTTPAPLPVPTPAPINGACGSANGSTPATIPTTNLCTTGTGGTVSGTGNPWSWNCSGSNGGATANCSASILVPVNGACGSANGTTPATIPTANFCTTGTSSGVTGTGNPSWSWSCSGSGGGTPASCSATLPAPVVNGVCGGADGTTVSVAPTANFCTTGTNGAVSGTGPWSWNCSGSGGGTTANCSASVPVLPDTGITSTQCYAAGSDTLVSCTSATAIALNDKQDGMIGKDVTTPDATDGKLGFSYSAVGSYPLTDCVQDNITGLMWEGKPTTGTRAAGNAYTNYGDSSAGDASEYVTTVNAGAGLCGHTDWRLPTRSELQSIVDYSVSYTDPTIDTTWFVNTPADSVYWTSTGYAGGSSNAWVVDFNDGYVSYSNRNDGSAVRLVR